MMIMAQHPQQPQPAPPSSQQQQQQQQQQQHQQLPRTFGGSASQQENTIKVKQNDLEKQSIKATQIKTNATTTATSGCNKSKEMVSTESAPVAADLATSSSHQNFYSNQHLNKENTQQKQHNNNNNHHHHHHHHQQHQQRQQLQGQDGKRTLIKNQLYLIEQLQLENANLRNERDQLELENEELKFQLQMISSSNILTQPGSAFNDRQLEKLVETNQKGGATASTSSTMTTTTVTTNSSAPNHFRSSNVIVDSMRPNNNDNSTSNGSCLTTTTSNNNHQQHNNYTNIVTSNSSLATITATPLRQPLRFGTGHTGIGAGSDDMMSVCNQSSSVVRDDKQQRQFPVVRSSTSVMDCSRRSPTSTSNNATCVPFLSSSTQENMKFNSAATNNSNKFLLSAKSNSLAAFNVNKNLVPNHLLRQNDLSSVSGDHNHASGGGGAAAAAIAYADDDDDDSSSDKLTKLLEQRYGNDGDRVHTAAIVIQRAFRKYQICKRFRAITEQLRLTCQSSSSQQQQQHATTTTTTTTKTTTSERHKRDTDKQQQQTSKSPSHDSAVPFASGATRAAAWESLSNAASRLAASAAAATANTKQALVNGVTKSASNHQVATALASASASATPPVTSGSQYMNPNRANVNNHTDHHQRPNAGLKNDPVFAAAINFQQLESIRKRQYRVGLNIFNKNPEKGVSFLIAHSFIDASPPYAKGSPSYYLSNQLHFIDNKQHLAAHRTTSSNSNNTNTEPIKAAATTALNFQSCQFCFEEENLKRNVAHFLLHRKGLAKEKIGQYLGNLQAPFNQDVLRYYLQELDFNGLQIDIALRKFSSTLRLPGEAQKIERFVDCFAQRYIQCQQQQQQQQQQHSGTSTNTIQLTSQSSSTNSQQQSPGSTPILTTQKQPSEQLNQNHQPNNYKNNLTLLSKDEIFILTFAIIMLNTDLHSPSLKSTSRMSASQFVHNLRGVFKSQMITEGDLIEIYERVKANEITTTPDHVTHVMKVQQGLTVTNFQRKELPNLCVPHRRLVCFCRLFEVYDVNKKERVGQHQREIFLFNDLLLVTKLARRARNNTTQQYAYRQSIPLHGLYVQLFQSTHYNFGIRLCQRSNDETLIMFNARNELDQSRFVDDLSESIAEMDEMESIRQHNIIDNIHFKQQERLRRHMLLHNSNENIDRQSNHVAEMNERLLSGMSNNYTCDSKKTNAYINKLMIIEDNQEEGSQEMTKTTTTPTNNTTTTTTPVKMSSSEQVKLQSNKFSSMSNLSTVTSSNSDSTSNESAGRLKANRSFAQNPNLLEVRQEADQNGQHNDSTLSGGSGNSSNSTAPNRSNSTGSVHSLDSGLFISRDVSPNQSA